MDLGTVGVFAFLDGLSGLQTGELARKVERLGYSALWIPEGAGRDPFAIGWDWSGTDRDRHDFMSEAGKPGARVLALTDADQLVADNIASYFREHRNDKVLVFIRRERLGLGRGVPYLVAQQTKARQLILNPAKSPAGPRLLAAN